MSGIDYSAERFADPEYLEARRARSLGLARFSGDHPGVVVAAAGRVA